MCYCHDDLFDSHDNVVDCHDNTGDRHNNVSDCHVNVVDCQNNVVDCHDNSAMDWFVNNYMDANPHKFQSIVLGGKRDISFSVSVQ